MSLAHSKGHPKGKGKEGWQLCSSKKSEKKARALSQPSFTHDAMLTGGQNNIHVNGNTKPQEPPFLQRRPSGSRLQPRSAGHIHTKPWTCSIALGRKENPNMTNPYHRVWCQDAGRPGRVYDGVDDIDDLAKPRRWNRARKQEHYQKYEAELNALKCHDEVFAVKANFKFWTHLQNKGAQAGGQQEKLETRYGMTGTHHIYTGKYDNVRHAQLMLKTGRKGKHNEPDEWVVDPRPLFDNRLHDDQVKYNEGKDKEMAAIAFDLFRPSNTRSCPQMGSDYMNR